MKKFLSLLLVLGFALQSSGCATAMSKYEGDSARKESVYFHSVPDDVTVIVDGVPAGITPFFMNLSHKKPVQLQFAKNGYQSETRQLGRTFNWWILGNLAIGVLPVFIDLAYGNHYRFDSDKVKIVLLPQR
jgi:hypothetical protein